MDTEINLSEIIFNSINELFNSFFSSIDTTIFPILDTITFIDNKILSETHFKKILGNNSSEGILLICNSLLFGLILYYSISFLFSHLTYSKTDSPKQFIFKLLIFSALMNSALWICEQIINIISLITLLLSDIGFNIFNTSVNFTNFINTINNSFYSSEQINFLSFTGFLKAFTSIGIINLILSYSLRYIMIQIFILTSPFAFFSLISSSTNWFFRTWLKSFLSLLFVQILIMLILLLAFSIPISGTSDFNKLLYIGTIYALTKANIFIKELFGGISTTLNSNLSNLFSK